MNAHLGAPAAAVLYGWGLMMLFVIRSHRHKAATGSTGYNGIGRTPGATAQLAGVCFTLAVVLGLAAPLLATFQLVPSLTGSVNHWTALPGFWVGLAAIAAGFTIAVVAQNTMGASWRIGVDQTERTQLVTNGVFAGVRNPIFTAMVAAQAGTAAMSPTWLSVLGVALLLVGVELQVRRVEEPYLARTHGADYTNYARRTGRFLPGIGLLASPPTLTDVKEPAL